MLESVLVANRGEIACRVIRTLNRLGIRSIAVYSDADVHAPHVRLADVAVRLGRAPAGESYLSIERVLAAASAERAQAIHPGYGFLSENPAFARACSEAGLVFVGPPAEAMELLGDKVTAKLAAQRAGVPVLPGLQRPGLGDEEIMDFARTAGALPLMVKAAAGGGGRGMRVVRDLDGLGEALGAARREALAGFGDDSLLVERYVERARHIEVQLLADAHGSVVHLGERECSLQRRHQKVVEESPSPVVSPELRERLGAAATELARAAGYVGAGTAEFLVSAEDPGEFFFLEVNARLQVEHPVTEMVTGLDLVEQQLRVAAGEALRFTQADVHLAGHAIEVRITAEDPASSFLPATGTVLAYAEPAGAGVRVDSGIELGSQVTSDYDSLLAKVIVGGEDREQAIDRLLRALGDLRVLGVTTNQGFLARLLADDAVRAGELDTGLIERGVVSLRASAAQERQAALAAAAVERLALEDRGDSGDPWDTLVAFRLEGSAPVDFELRRPGAAEAVHVRISGPPGRARAMIGADSFALSAAREGDRVRVATDGEARLWRHASDGAERWVATGPDTFVFRLLEPVVEGTAVATEGALEAPMPGTVLDVRVTAGDDVREGDVLVVIESMKMEMTLVAPGAATVTEVHVATGDGVRQGQPVVELDIAS